ncbi:MAG: class I SAM-dependent methyltransferase [Pseudomonadota bacterium]
MTDQSLPNTELHGLLDKFRYRVRTEGLLGSLAWLVHNIQWRVRERWLGIDTRDGEFAIVTDDDGEHHCYEAINTKCFEDAMSELELDGDNDVFFDYGSGKGRALILATRYPFKHIYGIERADELCDIAERNVGALRKPSARRITVIRGCAMATPLPDDVTVLLMANPFSGTVLQTALHQVQKSLVRAPRELRLIYIHPKGMHNMLAECDWLEEVKRIRPGYLLADVCILYSAASVGSANRKEEAGLHDCG